MNENQARETMSSDQSPMYLVRIHSSDEIVTYFTPALLVIDAIQYGLEDVTLYRRDNNASPGKTIYVKTTVAEIRGDVKGEPA